MKTKILVLSLILVLVLTACGANNLSKPMTLLNQNKEEVTFPLEKPTVLFFITAYT